MKAIFDGIYAKFTATTGGVHNSFYTALGGRMYLSAAPQLTTYPYAVYSLVSGVPDWTLSSDNFEDLIIQFSIFDDGASASTIATAFGYQDTLYHDCGLSITGYSSIYMYREMQHLLRDEEDDTWQFVSQYRLFLKKS
jgi:hypothetical protein